MSHKSHGIRMVRRWHARLGLAALLFLLLLVASGLALNHGDALGLQSVEVEDAWLASWYGLKAAAPAEGYPVLHDFLTWGNGKWVLGGTLVHKGGPGPVGAVEVGGVAYVATPRALHLFRADGRLVEKIEGRSLPGAPILRIGQWSEQVALDLGTGVYASADGLEWRGIGDEGVSWAHLQPLPEEKRRQLAARFAPALSLERILLDLHSGRLFGRYGPLCMDVLACALLALGLSGLWMYWRALAK